MSQFEFISVAASLVLSFGAMRYLSGAQSLANGRRTYWVMTLWAIQGLLNITIAWWSFWDFSAVEVWNLGTFLIALSAPAVFYIGACVIVPSPVSLDTDWRAHFYGNARKPLMIVAAAGALCSAFSQFLLVEDAHVGPVGGVFILTYAVGYIFSDPRVQGGVVIANLIAVLFVLIPAVYDSGVTPA
jgi:hypothetical protein